MGIDRIRQWGILSAASAFVLLLGAGTPALAGSVRHANSKQPHWQVGHIDPGLSNACRRRRFNQLADHRRYISYRGAIGTGVTGIAKKGWNLHDPDGRAVVEATYHFADDGLSTCRVYVAKEKTRVP